MDIESVKSTNTVKVMPSCDKDITAKQKAVLVSTDYCRVLKTLGSRDPGS